MSQFPAQFPVERIFSATAQGYRQADKAPQQRRRGIDKSSPEIVENRIQVMANNFAAWGDTVGRIPSVRVLPGLLLLRASSKDCS